MAQFREIFEKLAPVLIEQVLKQQGAKLPGNEDGAKVAVLKLHGTIMTGGRGGQNLNIDNIRPKLEAIAKMTDVKAIALDINSPGGSPTQSRMIADAIQKLAKDKKVPVYAFVQDVAASGGYWLACAASKIYVQPESIVGSIGVVSASFGFDKAIAKLGVERRVYTAGKSKVTMDPFQPENEHGIKMGNKLRAEIHDNFIGWVKSQRKGLSTKEELFDGSIWTGAAALENGIADEIGDLDTVMKKMYGPSIILAKPAVVPTGIQDLFGMAHEGVSSLGHAIGEGIVNATADRAENEVVNRPFRMR